MPITVEAFKKQGELFFENLDLELQRLGIDLSGLEVDHLCYRVGSFDEYNEKKLFLAGLGTLLTEAMVNGRPIATYQMHNPFLIKGRQIELLELPAPKPGTAYESGFEHAEAVIQESFNNFANKFPHLTFTSSGNKNLNPELALKTKAGHIKFHHRSLKRVIEVEKAQLTDLIFDLDGTLIQSRENILEINRTVFSAILNRPVSLDEAKEKFHPEFSKLFEAFQVTCPDLKKQAIANWGEVAQTFTCRLFDGVKELLVQVKEQGYRLHLWTARDPQSARAILQGHQLIDIFETLSFANEVESKPHPKSLAFEWQSAAEHSYLVVGDSATDIRGAKNVKALAIGALWDGHASHSALIEHGADALFFNISEFASWLKGKRAA